MATGTLDLRPPEPAAPARGAPEIRTPPPQSRPPVSLRRAPPAAATHHRRPPRQSYRFVRAYWTTFVVIASYLWFSVVTRFLGHTWADNHVGDVHLRNARRIEHTIVDLRGLFIKVGQLLSIMANFLPAQFRSGLEALQDQVPPSPYREIAARIEEELGRPVGAVFARFVEAPIASASLGQVHEAWLKDGTHVAVKVQHRDIDEIVRLDLKTIRRILAIVTFFVPVQGMDSYYHQIKSMISEELDFLREARNIRRIAANFVEQQAVRFPVPVDELCTARVMVTTYVDGAKVGDLAALDAMGVDRRALARRIVQVFCQQIFVDGVYHANPHPGNMLVGAESELILLDFGAVGELSTQMREGIPEFLEAVIRRDTDAIIKALRKMGFLARGAEIDVSEKVIEFFHQRFQEEVKLESFNLKDIKLDPQKGLESLIDLRKMNIGLKEISGSFHVPRDFVLLERTILLLTGVCTELDPDLNPMEVIRPYMQEFVLGTRDWAQIALEAAKDMGLKALTDPRRSAPLPHPRQPRRGRDQGQGVGAGRRGGVRGACGSSSTRRSASGRAMRRSSSTSPATPGRRSTASTGRARWARSCSSASPSTDRASPPSLAESTHDRRRKGPPRSRGRRSRGRHRPPPRRERRARRRLPRRAPATTAASCSSARPPRSPPRATGSTPRGQRSPSSRRRARGTASWPSDGKVIGTIAVRVHARRDPARARGGDRGRAHNPARRRRRRARRGAGGAARELHQGAARTRRRGPHGARGGRAGRGRPPGAGRLARIEEHEDVKAVTALLTAIQQGSMLAPWPSLPPRAASSPGQRVASAAPSPSSSGRAAGASCSRTSTSPASRRPRAWRRPAAPWR